MIKLFIKSVFMLKEENNLYFFIKYYEYIEVLVK